jgi:DNA-binding CsgD family transcriptional regulator
VTASYDPEPMLYGRDAERSRIGGILDGVRRSRSAVLVLRGDAGVGKSALLEAAGAQAEGIRVLRGRGIESEAQLPYAGLHQLLRPILADADHLPGPQGRALRGALGLEDGAGDEWFLVSLAVLTLLSDFAEREPVLCLVDDAHWLDAGSAEALKFAARRLDAERLAILFAARDGDARSFEAPEFEELRLTGLDAEASEALLDRRAPGLSRAARAQLIDGTGGNPLALLELSATLSEAQLVTAEPLFEPLPVSERIERAFLQRVRRLSDGAQTLLLVAAVDDAGATATVVAAATRLGAGVEALDEAARAGLLRVDGPRIEFHHPLFRSAVYHGAPLTRRQAAHLALAGLLTGAADADRRAWHRAAAAVAPDPQVVEELEQTGRRARQRSGFVPASLAFERASALATDERDRVRLLIAAGENAWFGGRPERSMMLLERALPMAGIPTERAEIDCWRALIEINVGVPADACELLLRSAPEMATTDAERGLYMLCVASLAAGYSGDDAAAVRIGELAGRMPAVDTLVGCFLESFLHGSCAFFAKDFAAAAPRLRAALALADDADATTSFRMLGLLLIAGGAGLFLGDDDAAQRLNRRLVHWARDTGALTLLTQALPRLALTQIPRGQWASAGAALEDGIRLAGQTGQHQVVAHMEAELALLAALRGDEETCRSLAALSTEHATMRRLMHVAHTARWALTVLELGRGRPEEALVHAREITTLPIVLWSAQDRIEAAVRAGDTASARSWLATVSAWAHHSRTAGAVAAVHHGEALLHGDDGEAAHAFADALEVHATAGRPFDRARTELAFGEHLRRARRRVEAREHLRAALGGFEALGAAAWAESARVGLRASGQTARRRDSSTRDELTAQELQIAQYVGEGLSNRDVAAQLFLSPRTIDFHLRNVFRKLGISSRIELARLDLSPKRPVGPPPVQV